MWENTVFIPKIIFDQHCHGRDQNQSHKTTIEQVLYEALQGLINITFFMPNTDPPITNQLILDEYISLIEIATKNLGITHNQYIYFGVTDDNITECELALKNLRVIGLKIYPKKPDGEAVTTGMIGVTEDNTILAAMKLVKKFDKVLAVHCDDPIIITREGNTIRAEFEYVKKIIRLALQVPGVKIIICHVSNRYSAEMILEAQKRGLKIALEICPHYLMFDSDQTNWNPGLDPVFYHCYNNLRGREHREFLVSLLADEEAFIIIGSDNACHTKEEKLKNKKLGGMPSNQEMVAVIATLAAELELSALRVAKLLAYNVSDFFNIPIDRTLIKYQLKKRVVTNTYNNGAVVNPWQGTKLLFPVPIQR